MKTRIIKFNEIESCFNNLADKNHKICIANVMGIQGQSAGKKKNRTGLEIPIGFWKMSFYLLTSSFAQLLEKASSFLDNFNRIVLPSLDHGLINRSVSKENTVNKIMMKFTQKLMIPLLVFSLLLFEVTFLPHVCWLSKFTFLN